MKLAQLTLGAVLFAALVPAALADLHIKPGLLAIEEQCEAESRRPPALLLDYFFELSTARLNGSDCCLGQHLRELKELPNEELRERLIARIKSHPEEVNDISFSDSYLKMHCLSAAIRMDDVELVRLLLEHGAIPYKPMCPNRPSSEEFDTKNDAIKALLHEARQQWPKGIEHPFFENLRVTNDCQQRTQPKEALPPAPAFTPVAAEADSIVLKALADYCFWVLNPKATERSDGYPGISREEARSRMLRIIRENPAHANDMYRDGCGWVTPLLLAVAIQDVTLIDLLFDVKAIPYLPDDDLLKLPLAPGVQADEQVRRRILLEQERFGEAARDKALAPCRH